MTCTLLPTLPGTTYRLSLMGLVAAVVMGAFAGIGRLLGSKSVNGGRKIRAIEINPIEDIHPIEISAIQDWLNSDSLNQSGRCRRCLR